MRRMPCRESIVRLAVRVSRPPRSPRALPCASVSLVCGLSLRARASLACELAGAVVRWSGKCCLGVLLTSPRAYFCEYYHKKTAFPRFRACCARRVSTCDGGERETSALYPDFIEHRGPGAPVGAARRQLEVRPCVAAAWWRLKNKNWRAPHLVSTVTSGRGRAHGNRRLVVPDAMLHPSASRATCAGREARASACVCTRRRLDRANGNFTDQLRGRHEADQT